MFEPLLDVAAICDQRDQYRNWLQAAEELIRTAPIHHYGKDYTGWIKRRDAFLRLCSQSWGGMPT